MKSFGIRFMVATLMASPVAYAQKPKSPPADLMRIVNNGQGIYTDTCRRSLDFAPKIAICLAGNGWYNETLINDFFVKTNWFGKDPTSAERVSQVRFACIDLAGKKPEVARLVIPRLGEYMNGQRSRIEIPCDATREQVAQQMKVVTVVLSGLKTADRAPLVEQVDQVRVPCGRQDSKSKEKCQEMRTLVAKVFASQIKEESVPALTIAGIQLVSGLNQAPPTVTAQEAVAATEPTQKNYQTQYFEELRKVERELTKVLPSCGLSLAERFTDAQFNSMQADPKLIAAPDTSKIRWKACLDEIEIQKKELERQGLKLEPGAVVVDGERVASWDALQSEDPRVKKAMSLTMRAGSTQLDLAQEMVRKKDIPGNKTDWENTVRAASFVGAIICPQNGQLGMGFGMGMAPTAGTAEEVASLARQLSVSDQAFQAAKQQAAKGCVSVKSVRVTAAGQLEFTFGPAGNPYGGGMGAGNTDDGARGEGTF